MKTSLGFLAVLMLSALWLPAKEVPMINKSGEVKFVEKHEEFRPLTEEETIAMENPGQEVPVNLFISNCRRVGFWHIVRVKSYNTVVVFEDGKIQTVSKAGTIDGEPEFAIYVLFCLVAVTFMFISNRLMWRGNIGDAAFAAFAAFAALAAIAAFAVAAFAALALIASAFAAFAFAASHFIKIRWICFVFFCILIVMAMFV